MNIATRGSIEFLAVLLGLSGSLWIDGNIKENEARKQNTEILTRLYNNLRADSLDGEWNRKAYERGIKGCKNVIKWCDLNPSFSIVNDSIEKDISTMLIATFFGNNEEEYNSLKNSGKMHLINNKSLISDLHRYYTFLNWTDYVDADTWRLSEEEVGPFLSNYADELYFNRNDTTKKNVVYSIYPKINLVKLPEIEKLRFYASKKLWHHDHQARSYARIVREVSMLRESIREELNL